MWTRARNSRATRLLRRFHHLLGGEHARQVARHLEQRVRAPLAMRGDARLEAQAGGELADDEADREHDAEGQHVLDVGHAERQAWRHEEVVEGADVEHRRQRRRTAPVAQRDAEHREQKEHDDVRQVEHHFERQGQGRQQCAGGDGDDVAGRPAARLGLAARACSLRRRTRRAGGRADFDQVDVGSHAAELLRQRSGRPPDACLVVAHDDLRQVVLARMRRPRPRPRRRSAPPP